VLAELISCAKTNDIGPMGDVQLITEPAADLILFESSISVD